MQDCYCHAAKDCLACWDFFNKKPFAQTALELMRSRYCAYVAKNADYLLHTWEQTYRPATIEFSANTRWIKLEIVSSTLGGKSDQTGIVHFQAYYIEQQQLGILEERSNFVQRDNHWYYCDGEIMPHHNKAIARNESCPCGSGKKFKRCCQI